MSSLRDEIYSRYREIHEDHLGVGREERAAGVRALYYANIRPHLVEGNVLEIGCGAGDLLDEMWVDYREVFGTDLCPENVAACVERGHWVRQTDWLLANAEYSPAGIVDNIVLMGIIEHFTKDELLHVVDTLHRLLRPGGVVILTTQNMDSPIGAHFRYLDLTHEVGFTRESLCQLGRLRFREAECFPWVHSTTAPANWKGRLLEAAQRTYRALYRAHVWMLGGWYRDTWYDVDNLVGVWRK